jgi:hypothetical protein
MAERLDEERLEILRSWGVGLAADTREEVRAAGKAIMILIDEIERLHVDLWHARGSAGPVEPGGDESGRIAPEPASSQELATSLRDRLKAAIPSRTPRDRSA